MKFLDVPFLSVPRWVVAGLVGGFICGGEFYVRADCVALPPGATAWWTMEGDASESLGGNHGVLSGGVTEIGGEVGSALMFDGVASGIRVPAASELDLGAHGGLTIELWVRPNSVSANAPLLEWNSGNGETAFHFWLAFSGTQLFVNMGTVNGYMSTRGVLAAGEWQHVAFTYDRVTGYGRLYRNGSQVESRFMGVGHRALTTRNLYLGVRPAGNLGGTRYAGGMDELGLYTRALSQSELAAIYEAGSEGKCAVEPPGECAALGEGAVGWWRLEGDGTDALGANDGLASAGAVFPEGQVGLGMFFDGPGDQVAVPASPSLDLGAGEGMTVELWINPSSLSGYRPMVEWNLGSGTAVSSLGFHFWHSFESPGNLFVSMPGLDSPNGFMNSPGGVVMLGRWQHVAFTYDRASGMGRLYHDGVEVAAKPIGEVRAQTTHAFYLGVRAGGPLAGATYAGVMDEVTLYSRALSGPEIIRIHAAGHAGKCPPEPPPVPPVIIGEPQDVEVEVGQTAEFLVEATRAQTYQWFFNGNPVPGEAGPRLVLEEVQETQEGDYRVVVSNGFGDTSSRTARLSVLPIGDCVPASAGAVALWPLDGDAIDLMRRHDGVVTGEPEFGGGRVGMGMIFDGEDDEVHVPGSPGLDLGAAAGMTIECWIKPDTLEGYRPLAEWNQGESIYSLGMHFWHSFEHPGNLFVSMPGIPESPDGYMSTGPGVVTAGEWQHVAFTYDKLSGIGTLYRNGVEVGTKTIGVVRAQTTYQFYMGARPGGPLAGSRYEGGLDELALYNRALSGEEIAAIYAAGVAGKCDPVCHDVGDAFSLESNPSGAWSYGYSSELGHDFTLLEVPVSEIRGTVEVRSWRFEHDQDPGVFHNPTDETLIEEGGQGVYPPGATWFFAGDEGTTRNYGVIRFTVPAGDKPNFVVDARVESHLQGTLSGDSDFHVVINGKEVFGEFLPPSSATGYSGLFSLTAGDTIDFAVGRGADGLLQGSGLIIEACILPTDEEPPREDCPVADIRVVEPIWFDEEEGFYIAVSADNIQASVIFDGTESADVNGDPLNFLWLHKQLPTEDDSDGQWKKSIKKSKKSAASEPVSSGAVEFEEFGEFPLARGNFGIGTHVVLLVVDDGTCASELEVVLKVITANEAVGRCVQWVESSELDRKEKRSLTKSLEKAAKEFDKGKFEKGIEGLRKLADKVTSDGGLDPELGAALVGCIEDLISMISQSWRIPPVNGVPELVLPPVQR